MLKHLPEELHPDLAEGVRNTVAMRQGRTLPFAKSAEEANGRPIIKAETGHAGADVSRHAGC